MIAEFGTYFIYELFKKYKALGNYDDYINSSLLKKHVNFGGIRVENYFVISPMGPQLLGMLLVCASDNIESIRKNDLS